MWLCAAVCCLPFSVHAERGSFDSARWYSMLDSVRTRAAAENISSETVNATLKYPSFIPSIVRSDANQSEFKLTLDGYLARTVNQTRIRHCCRALMTDMVFRRMLCWLSGGWNRIMVRLNRGIN